MNFEYNEEQKLLKESAERWAQDNYSFEQRNAAMDNDDGYSTEHYATFAELGWLSVPFAEEYGGYGGGIIDIAAIMEEMGKALVVEPVFANMVLFGGLLEQSSHEALKSEIIPQIIDGSLMGGVAMYEPQSRFDMSNIATTATASGENYSISGTKSVVLNGASAQKLIVTARTSGEQNHQDGISLFLVDVDADGVSLNNYPLMDGQQVADINFEKVNGVLISELDKGYAPLVACVDRAHIALCAEAVGIMEVLNRTTVEYTKTRKQFGVQISSFQALQHRMVDTFMAYEQAKSILIGALCELSDPDTNAAEAQKILTATRTLIAKNGKHIGDEAIQLHGGMGLTDEMSVGHYVKRLMMINLIFGDQSFFQEQYNQVAYG